MGPGLLFEGIYYYVSKEEPTQASTIRKSLVLYRERGGVVSCVVLYCGPQWYCGKRRLIFMPVPVVQKELIWDATCESLSLLVPIPWVYPLGAVPRWAGVGGGNTSRSCRCAAMVGHALPPFRSVKNTIQNASKLY